jgi:hypothetical protein
MPIIPATQKVEVRRIEVHGRKREGGRREGKKEGREGRKGKKEGREGGKGRGGEGERVGGEKV